MPEAEQDTPGEATAVETKVTAEETPAAAAAASAVAAAATTASEDAPAPKAADGDAEDADDKPAEEEECQAVFSPVVQLDKAEEMTGEEEENCLFDSRALLYRYVDQVGAWEKNDLLIGSQRKREQAERLKKKKLLLLLLLLLLWDRNGRSEAEECVKCSSTHPRKRCGF